MGSGRIWLDSEIQFMIRNWENITDDEMAIILDRPVDGVRSKRKRMGLARTNRKYSFQDVVKEFSKTNYELLSDENDYRDAAQNTLKYICPRHRDKGIQTISLGHLQSGRGCYYCGREKTIEGKMVDLDDARYADLCHKKNLIHFETKRINGKIYVGYICPIHSDAGVQYSTFHNMEREFKNGIGCPICHASRWENQIRNILNSLSIPFESEKKFEDLKDKTHLRFDFYLPTVNKAIEYDGMHHFAAFCFNGISKEKAEKNFNETLKRDKLKDEYCNKHNIPLLRIPYYEFDNAKNIIIDFLG